MSPHSLALAPGNDDILALTGAAVEPVQISPLAHSRIGLAREISADVALLERVCLDAVEALRAAIRSGHRRQVER